MLIYSVFFSSLFIYLFRVYSAFEIEGGEKKDPVVSPFAPSIQILRSTSTLRREKKKTVHYYIAHMHS